jgi:molecular chaperone DnaK
VRTVLEGSDFGQDAIRKAERVMEMARKAMEGNDHQALKTSNEALARTLNMFKGVVQKLG